ncbi:MAG: AI-2E family transporter [Peptococcaceae bacterium]|nr:AI-2E family transporter [Peptococcaceae bacterium]
MSAISWGKWYPSGFRAALLVLFLTVAYLARALFLSFVLAAALAYLVHPLVTALERRGHGRSFAIWLSFAAFALVGAALVLSLLPALTAQLSLLTASLPTYAVRADRAANYLESTYLRMIPAVLTKYLDQRIFASEEAVLAIVRHLLDGLLQMVKMVLWLALVPVIAYYLLRDGARWKELAVGFLPPAWQGEAAFLLVRMDALVSAFLRGQLLICGVVALLSWGALALLGVEWAAVLGLFAGLTELIPYFGPLIGAGPAVALALLSGPWPALKVVIAFLLIQQLEGNIISPKLMGDRLGLHPLAIITALVAGGGFGLAGLLLAVPVLAFLTELLRFLADVGRRGTA